LYVGVAKLESVKAAIRLTVSSPKKILAARTLYDGLLDSKKIKLSISVDFSWVVQGVT
jgi:hypothetical protein